MKTDIKALVSQLTLEEKAGLCSGADFWHTKAVDRLGIPAIMVSDGPHGLRKQDQRVDHLGVNESIKAVCFPTASAYASSFDRDLLRCMGEALGDECQAEDLAVLLGPAINIKRSPLCGRNFEYFSEDPYLAGELAASYIGGVQSKNVGTSLKHFAANNQEHLRLTTSADVDERTLREIYLAAFETAVKKTQPWTIMCSYNRINGVHASEDEWLLTKVLRDEWGFEGFVVSDWGAVNDRVKGLAAGLELEMPASGGYNDAKIVKAVQEGELDEAVLDKAVERILNIVFRAVENSVEREFDKEGDHAFAVNIEEQSAVLLQNTGTLPLQSGQKVAFIGGFAETPRFQGGGSSHINAYKVTSALEAAQGRDVIYAKGFAADRDERDETLYAEAIEAAKSAEVAVVFAGLPDSFESEGYDREHMRLPDCQNQLIELLLEVQPNLVVVLHNGSPVELPWADKVPSILEMYLGGQGVGEAAVRLLWGEANPSGKLAESFPFQLSDNPSYLNFPGAGKTVEYREGVFVGYRYYEKKKMPVRYAFGHGLSYTSFAYSNLRLSAGEIADTDTLTVEVDVTNTGKVAGAEAVQLYVRDTTGAAIRPEKELKGFDKLHLAPGETKTARFELDKRSFAWYNVEIADWYCASGAYEILVGGGSDDIRLCACVQLNSTVKLPFVVDGNTTIEELLNNEATKPLMQKILAEKLPDIPQESQVAQAAIGEQMKKRSLLESPLRSGAMFAGMSGTDVESVIEEMNKALGNS